MKFSIPLNEFIVVSGAKYPKKIPLHTFSTGAKYDSRLIEKGDLFFAFKGLHVDGHNFLEDAKIRGAVAAIVSRPTDVDIIQLVVPNVEYAFGEYARLHRSRLNGALIAITGSVGKTTLKEFIFHSLHPFLLPHKSRKNYNTEIGVPMSLCEILPKNRLSIVELAMRGEGQISYLSQITRPDISVITNIGLSHIELLGSKDRIAKAKSEITDYMDVHSLLVVNRDDDFYSLARDSAKGTCISFGEHLESDYIISDISFDSRGRTSLLLNGNRYTFELSSGKHHARNLACVAAISDFLRLDTDRVIEHALTFRVPERRGTMTELPSGTLLFDNSYNAAPDSMISSLDTLSVMKSSGLTTVAVLGDMFELGKYSEEAHRAVGAFITSNSPDYLVTIGSSSGWISDEAKVDNSKHFDSIDNAINMLTDLACNDTAMLLQASNGMNFDKIVPKLIKNAEYQST